MSAIERSVIYGSSSLCIPRGIEDESPVWNHAENRLQQQNPVFSELNYRRGDNTHLAVAFLDNEPPRLVGQQELERVVSARQLPGEISHLVLQQFAFDPQVSSIGGLGRELPFTQDHHRSLAVLMVAKSGAQFLVAGPPEFYLTAKDYDRVITDVGDYYGESITLVLCLDLGMAGGFTVLHDNSLLKPNFQSVTGSLTYNPVLSHTGSMALVEI